MRRQMSVGQKGKPAKTRNWTSFLVPLFCGVRFNMEEDWSTTNILQSSRGTEITS